MYGKKKILAVIPARGGSKGIPRKNIRFLAGRPLIAYVLQTAKQSKYIDDVVVSTEDEEIREIVKEYGFSVVTRPMRLAEDDVPLDPVIFHALKRMESKESYDYVISMQPTSPLLKAQTLDKAIEVFVKSGKETLITVTDETHLYWINRDGVIRPLYKERKNRQYLDPIYKETGALFISRRDVVTEKSRIGSDIYLFELSPHEGIDIDTYDDWLLVENILNRLRIVFRVDADQKIGLGHIYRALTLASRLFNYDVFFLMDQSKKLGIKKVKEYNFKVIEFNGEDELYNKLEELSPHIVINDILDTKREYISKLKERGYFVVNFEDLGTGASIADVVINALYERSAPPHNSYYGHKYVCLRDEFYIFRPRRIRKKVKQILALFGGVDQNNLTLRFIKAIKLLNLKDVLIFIVLGRGYKFQNTLYPYVNLMKDEGFKIRVQEDVKFISKLIRDSDIVVTSNGRTVYEIASMGVPTISISQNEREVRHLFSQICRGVMDLGIANNVSDKDLAEAIACLIGDFSLRKDMSAALRSFNLRGGLERVLKIILEKYWENRK